MWEAGTTWSCLILPPYIYIWLIRMSSLGFRGIWQPHSNCFSHGISGLLRASVPRDRKRKLLFKIQVHTLAQLLLPLNSIGQNSIQTCLQVNQEHRIYLLIGRSKKIYSIFNLPNISSLSFYSLLLLQETVLIVCVCVCVCVCIYAHFQKQVKKPVSFISPFF